MIIKKNEQMFGLISKKKSKETEQIYEFLLTRYNEWPFACREKKTSMNLRCKTIKQFMIIP